MRIQIQTSDNQFSYVDTIELTDEAKEARAQEKAYNTAKENFQTVLSSATDSLASEQSTDTYTVSSDLDAIFTEAANTYGVDKQLLLAMAKQESDFDPNATSYSGAMGIMQLMPSTAEELGVSDAYDPYQNIMGGAKYISQLLEKYNGDVSLALAAYNAGSGNVAKYNGVPPSAQNYVDKVLAYYNDSTLSAPSATYTVETSDQKEAEKLSALMKEFSQHESYDYFIQEVMNELDGTTVTYDELLAASQQAISNIISAQ